MQLAEAEKRRSEKRTAEKRKTGKQSAESGAGRPRANEDVQRNKVRKEKLCEQIVNQWQQKKWKTLLAAAELGALMTELLRISHMPFCEFRRRPGRYLTQRTQKATKGIVGAQSRCPDRIILQEVTEETETWGRERPRRVGLSERSAGFQPAFGVSQRPVIRTPAICGFIPILLNRGLRGCRRCRNQSPEPTFFRSQERKTRLYRRREQTCSRGRPP